MFVILVNVTIKLRQFKKIHKCLTSCQTTSGAPIGDLIVAFCTHFISRKSHERAAPNAEQNFLLTQKLSMGGFPFTLSAIRGSTRPQPSRPRFTSLVYARENVSIKQLFISRGSKFSRYKKSLHWTRVKRISSVRCTISDVGIVQQALHAVIVSLLLNVVVARNPKYYLQFTHITV